MGVEASGQSTLTGTTDGHDTQRLISVNACRSAGIENAIIDPSQSAVINVDAAGTGVRRNIDSHIVCELRASHDGDGANSTRGGI